MATGTVLVVNSSNLSIGDIFMTKQEMIQEINAHVSDYLGFDTAISGLSNRRKSKLESILADCREIAEYKAQARQALGDMSQQEQIALCLMLNDIPDGWQERASRYAEYCRLSTKANNIWIKGW